MLHKIQSQLDVRDGICDSWSRSFMAVPSFVQYFLENVAWMTSGDMSAKSVIQRIAIMDELRVLRDLIAKGCV